jgi:hypothetical protein
MKRNIFLTMLVMILAFGMTVVSCDDGGDDNNNNNGNSNGNGNGGDIVTPTGIDVRKNSGGVTFIEFFGFVCNRTDSTLPGFTNTELSSIYTNTASCGFSISRSGTTIPVTRVQISSNNGTQWYIAVVTDTTLISAGQQVTLSYTPNGTHIFKATKVTVSGSTLVTLGAFTLTGTAQ